MRRRVHSPGYIGGMSGPFDGINDMAAGYSLRRLRGSYTGPLVKLRRASDNAELDFGSGLNSVDFGQVSAWAGGDAFATTFYDQSGNSRNLTQSTVANQPQIINASNGRSALLFDGVNDCMRTGAFTLNQPWSFNIVYRRLTVIQANFENVFDGITADRGTLYHQVLPTNSDNSMYAGTTFVGDNNVSMPTGTRGAVGGQFNAASSLMEVNAAAIASFTGNVSTNNIDGFTLGTVGSLSAVRFSNIEVQEWCTFNTAHTSAQLKADNAAMRAAWNF